MIPLRFIHVEPAKVTPRMEDRHSVAYPPVGLRFVHRLIRVFSPKTTEGSVY